jgi:hypothetical protein
MKALEWPAFVAPRCERRAFIATRQSIDIIVFQFPKRRVKSNRTQFDSKQRYCGAAARGIGAGLQPGQALPGRHARSTRC